MKGMNTNLEIAKVLELREGEWELEVEANRGRTSASSEASSSRSRRIESTGSGTLLNGSASRNSDNFMTS